MSLFSLTAPTPYDLNFRIGPFPVRVHPLFWVIMVVFALSGGDWWFAPIWVGVMFVSILIHELGHAVAMRFYGQSASIVLHAMGGQAIPEAVQWGRTWASVALSLNQEIRVYAAGPAAGFALALLVWGGAGLAGAQLNVGFLLWVLPIPQAFFAISGWAGALLNATLSAILFVNFFWGVINLLPVYPLDGGQIAQRALAQIDPVEGGRKAAWLSVIAGGVAAAIGLLFLRSALMALLFGFLAFQSYQTIAGRRVY
jgi:Zn-dependent protease